MFTVSESCVKGSEACITYWKERLEDADRDLPHDEHAAGEKTLGHLAEAHEQADGRRDRVGHEVGGAGRLREALRRPLRTSARLASSRPNALDHGAAGVGLLHAPGELAERGLTRGGKLERRAGHDLGGYGREQGERDKRRREHQVVRAHHHDGAADHRHHGDQSCRSPRCSTSETLSRSLWRG